MIKRWINNEQTCARKHGIGSDPLQRHLGIEHPQHRVSTAASGAGIKLVFCIGLSWCLSLIGCGPTTIVVGASAEDQRLVATIVEEDGQWFSNRVAVIDVSGMILNGGKPGLLSEGENPVSTLHEKMSQAEADPKVKAIILRLNTPGGTVTGSDAMYRTVTRFKKRSGKPVVALMMDVTASGGYYLACAADEIVAYPTAVTGSIGVILQTISFKPAMGRIGIHAEALTSGVNKDAGSMFSTLTDEHRAILQGLVDDFYQRFLNVVRQARPGIPPDRFAEVTDGRVVTGTAAVELGLADQTGDLYDAFAIAKRLAKIQQADLVVYHRPLQYVGSPYASASGATASRGLGSPPHTVGGAAGTQINLVQFNLSAGTTDPSVGFYYLWPAAMASP